MSNTYPHGTVLDVRDALLHLYPDASYGQGYRLTLTPEAVHLTDWTLPTPPPTPEEIPVLAAAYRARAEQRATLSEYQSLLDERYALYTRADATDNQTAKAEIRDEIQMILAAIQEVRDALSAA